MTVTKDKYLSDKYRISIENLIRSSKRFCMIFSFKLYFWCKVTNYVKFLLLKVVESCIPSLLKLYFFNRKS